MLKYENIIARLSESAKIDILTNLGALSDRELISVGLPSFKSGTLEQVTKGIYPPYAYLANAWDTGLVRKIAGNVGSSMLSQGIGFGVLPSAKIKINPYRSCVSEDAHLSSRIAEAYALGLKDAGVTPCISGFSIEPDEVAWLDRLPDNRIIYEYIVKPYINAMQQGGVSAMVREDLHARNYEDRNHMLASLFGKTSVTENSYAVCEHVSAENTVRYVNEGIVCLQGAGYALQAALRKYVNAKKAVDRGEMREEDLISEIKRGSAISPEMLDSALDRVIEFINFCSIKYAERGELEKDTEALALDASRESVVLLKNKANFLPITKKAKIAIIGDIAKANDACTEALKRIFEGEQMELAGVCRGYDLAKDIPDPELCDEAMKLSESVDVVILFVGTDEKKEKYITRTQNLSLPANQEMLAHRLALSCPNKVVAVLSSNYALDTFVLDNFASLIISPIQTKYGAQAIAEVVLGKVNPSGRLAYSIYRNADKNLQKHRKNLRGGMMSGRFLGYRYYDAALTDIGYPFGFGLGYTKFAYSGFTVNKDGKAQLTLKNVGKRAGYEVVQLYAGLSQSSQARPKKELVGFEKVFLEAGESRTVSLDFEFPKIFDTSSNTYVTERGAYDVYVGSSVSDIKAHITVSAGDKDMTEACEDASRYLESRSNIISDNYTLEARYSTMKKTIKNIFAGVAFILFAILIQVYCVSANTTSTLLNLLTVASVIAASVFFIIDAVDKKRIGDVEKAEAEKANEKWFEDATKLEEFDTHTMFADEFADENDDGEEEHETQDAASSADEYLAYIDKDFTFELAASELEKFAIERGCKIDQSTVCSLLSALASSRVVVLSGLSKDEFVKLSSMLCEYFECTSHIDTVDSGYTDGASLFFRTDASGNRSKTGVLRVIEEAGKVESDLHLAILASANKESLANSFEDVVKYAKNPYGNIAISSIPEKYRFAPNICFLVGLEAGATLNDISEDVASVATVMDIRVSLSAPSANLSSVHRLKYYQLDYMSERAVTRSEVDESIWKKVDKLEEFACKHIEFSIGNKQWLGIEKYVAVYTACNGELDEAIDRVVASKIIPGIVATTVNTEGAELELADEVEIIFGENNAENCRKVIRSADLSRNTKKS